MLPPHRLPPLLRAGSAGVPGELFMSITRQVVSRLRLQWRLKIVLSVLLPAIFAACYLQIQRHPLFPVTAMPLTGFDRWLPFLPGTVYLYESLWLITAIGPSLMASREELYAYCRGVLAVGATSFTFFLLCPTSSPRPLDLSGANTAYRVLTGIDNELNAFPSLHVALAVFSAACAYAVLPGNWRRWTGRLIWVWALGITVSTLLTKQHVVADVVAGAALGFAGHAIARRTIRRTNERVDPA